MNSHIDESRDVNVTDMGESIRVFVPISWKRTGGRKQIILPEDPLPEEDKPTPLQIALARAYVWQKWIDGGRYANAKELANDIDMDPAVVRQVLRLGMLSPRVVEWALDPAGPDISLQVLLDMDVPMEWADQERMR